MSASPTHFPATSPVPTPAPPSPLWPGLLLATVVAVVALVLGRWLPLVGGPVFGILLGVLIRNTVSPPRACEPGIRFAGKKILQWSIIALGFGLSLTQVARTGMESLTITAVTIVAAFTSALVLGKLLNIPSKLKLLIGAGTAICGGSAIAAVTPIIKADEHDTAFAISTIFLFNLVAVLVFPALGHLMDLSQQGFGLWAGTAINDTSSVVAAGYSYGKEAGDHATIVKLTRATLIIPMCLILAAIEAWKHKKSGASDFRLSAIVPWFILWFVVASAARTLGLIPEAVQPAIHVAANFLIIMALTAIGLSADLRRMAGTGFKPIALGLGVWIAVAVSSLAVQFATGQV
ncbi:YeiH family putative sulfate export transporter [Lysobacter ciconiae]|uniref:YeiH family putative sulfate export transporter n=1 Tax=Novilysobacter ciconiae TaxID=2781022 RepID=A0A7S6UE24_9GAMM|nr:YeiH family protein [Lysobacter ciconiae]QOW18565.1 YeiH family putative sulfate export transporter [Lysobacter ciconiae]